MLASFMFSRCQWSEVKHHGECRGLEVQMNTAAPPKKAQNLHPGMGPES